MQIGRMTEKQVTGAYHAGKITLAQYHKRLSEIATSRHATELKKNPMKRYYATGALPGSRPRRKNPYRGKRRQHGS